jgi:hypothetical protein
MTRKPSPYRDRIVAGLVVAAVIALVQFVRWLLSLCG